MRLKLLVDKRRQKVLFVEAGKDFVDFLFTIPSLPIGAVIKLLRKSAIGDGINMYESLENMDPMHMKRSHGKATLLCIKRIEGESVSTRIFSCSRCGADVERLSPFGSPVYCEKCLTRSSTYFASAAGDVIADSNALFEGYVKDKVSYTIMDDLFVEPSSAFSLFNRFNNSELRSAEEKVVDVGVKEALELLRASVQSAITVLTDVFLAQET